MDIPYTKMSGAGNTFIVVDSRRIPDSWDLAKLAQILCSESLEHHGADGFIAVSGTNSTDTPDFIMHYFNRDGSTGMMCGNGGRCAVQFAIDHELLQDTSQIGFSNAGIEYRAQATNLGIKVFFPEPLLFRFNLQLMLFDTPRICHYADVGTPHAVLFVDELQNPEITHVSQLDLNLWGPVVRHHPEFAPDGANANFVEITADGSAVLLRTFERGVEAETGACGTGAISTGIIAHLLRNVPTPVPITVTSGATLYVDFTKENDHIRNLSLEGGAETVQRGVVDVSFEF